MAKKTKKSSTKLSVTDYEKLGRTLESIFEGGYINHWRVYRINFVRGLLFGFGATLGGTIVVTFLVWFLSLFGEIPLIGALFDTVSDSIQQ